MTDLLPLAEIEESVQRQAMSIAVDMATTEGRDALRRLIDGAIESWQLEAARFGRRRPLVDPDAIARRAWCNLAQYGPLTALLDDQDVPALLPIAVKTLLLMLEALGHDEPGEVPQVGSLHREEFGRSPALQRQIVRTLQPCGDL
jgi:hypothetical protein